MPKAKQTFGVEVNESTTGDTRMITVTIMVPAAEFTLSDLLRQRGAIGPVEVPLKQAVRETVQAYLDGAEDLIAGLAAGQRKPSNGAKPKPKEAAPGNGHASENGVSAYVMQITPGGAGDEVLTLQ